MNWKKTLVISVLILSVAIVVTFIIFQTEPKAKRQGASKQTAMLVDVIEVKRGNHQPVLEVTGTVQAAKDIILRPRISGEVIRMSPAFVPGGFVKKGQLLLQIDPSDYRNAVALRKSELHQAKADLNIEKGRQEVAKQDFELLGDTIPEEDRSLVLREPQLEAAKASVEAAKASLAQAELDLARTSIRAPFDAHIISRNVNEGSQVATGDALGNLVGMDEYWVMLTVPLSKVHWLRFPNDKNEKGGTVKIYDHNAWPEGVYRTGYLYKQIGALEDQTRMARVLVSVPDPMAYQLKDTTAPPLILGSFVEAHIPTKQIQDVVRLNRDYLRQNETVWVMQDNKLQIRDVEIVFKDVQYAYIREGLTEGDKVVTTNLTTVVEDAKLRTETDSIDHEMPDSNRNTKADTQNQGRTQ